MNKSLNRLRPALLLALCLLLAAPCARASDSPLAGALQCILVLAPDWESHAGTLRRFERDGELSPWKQAGSEYNALLGKNGLGWGRGLHGFRLDRAHPYAREGSGRSPAGVFTIPTTFGYLPPGELRLNMPYLRRTANIVGVEDPASRYYNRFVDKSTIPDPDWDKSSERGLDTFPPHFEWGFQIGHNTDPIVPQGGSMIHVHCSAPGDTQTQGCTALAPEAVRATLLWLDAAKNPVIVQLPADQYARYKPLWNLP